MRDKSTKGRRATKNSGSHSSQDYSQLYFLYSNAYKANQAKFFQELDKHMQDLTFKEGEALLNGFAANETPHLDIQLKVRREVLGNVLYLSSKEENKGITLTKANYFFDMFKYQHFFSMDYASALKIFQEPLITGPAKGYTLLQLSIQSNSFRVMLTLLEGGFSLDTVPHNSPARNMFELMLIENVFFVFYLGMVPAHLTLLKEYLVNPAHQKTIAEAINKINDKDPENNMHFDDAVKICLQNNIVFPVSHLESGWQYHFATVLNKELLWFLADGREEHLLKLIQYIEFVLSLSSNELQDIQRSLAKELEKIKKYYQPAINSKFLTEINPQFISDVFPPFILSIIARLKKESLITIVNYIHGVLNFLVEYDMKCAPDLKALLTSVVINIWDYDKENKQRVPTSVYVKWLITIGKLKRTHPREAYKEQMITWGPLKGKTFEEIVIRHNDLEIYKYLVVLQCIDFNVTDPTKLLTSPLYLSILHKADLIFNYLLKDKKLIEQYIIEDSLFQYYSPLLYALFYKNDAAVKAILLAGGSFITDIMLIKAKPELAYLKKLYIETWTRLINTEIEQLTAQGITIDLISKSKIFEMYLSDGYISTRAKSKLVSRLLRLVDKNPGLLQIAIGGNGNLDVFVATKNIRIIFSLEPAVTAFNQFPMITETIAEAKRIIDTFASLANKTFKFQCYFSINGLSITSTDNYINKLISELQSNNIQFTLNRDTLTILYTEENVEALIKILTNFNTSYEEPVVKSSSTAILANLNSAQNLPVATAVTPVQSQPSIEVTEKVWVSRRPWADIKPKYIVSSKSSNEFSDKGVKKKIKDSLEFTEAENDNANQESTSNRKSDKKPNKPLVPAVAKVQPNIATAESYSFAHINNHKALHWIIQLSEVMDDANKKVKSSIMDLKLEDNVASYYALLGSTMELFYYLHKVAKRFQGVNEKIIDAADAAEAKNIVFYFMNDLSDVQPFVSFAINSLIPPLKLNFEENGQLPASDDLKVAFHKMIELHQNNFKKISLSEASHFEIIINKLMHLKSIYLTRPFSLNSNNESQSFETAAYNCAINYIAASITEDCRALSPSKYEAVYELFDKLDAPLIRNEIRHPSLNNAETFRENGKLRFKFGQFFHSQQADEWVKKICGDGSRFEQLLEELQTIAAAKLEPVIATLS